MSQNQNNRLSQIRALQAGLSSLSGTDKHELASAWHRAIDGLYGLEEVLAKMPAGEDLDRVADAVNKAKTILNNTGLGQII